MAIRPENILIDGQDYAIIKGIKIRKATFGALLQNATLLASSKDSMEKENIKNLIAELVPGLIALGMTDHIVWKNPEIQTIIEDVKEKLGL